MFILRAFFAASASIIVLFAITKILGNKQISQLNMFDYINGITIGSIAAEMALSNNLKDIAVTGTAMFVYGLTGYGISWVTMNYLGARKFFSGEPLLLIENGKFFRENIKKSKLDLDDLLTAARCAGFFKVSDIAFAVMEPNGRISFCPTEASRPVSLSDLGQQPPEQELPINLIIDGIIMEKNIENANYSVKELSDELRRQGYRSPDEIFLAVLDGGSVAFYPKTLDQKKYDYYK